MRIRRSYDYLRVLTCVFFVMLVAWFINGLSPAEASHRDVIAQFEAPSLNLKSDVVRIFLEDRSLNAPSDAVGAFYGASNKVLLIGHRGTVFYNLDTIKVGDMLIFDGTKYTVSSLATIPKESVDMNEVLAAAETETLVVMTCAGRDLGDGDATHRLIVKAEIARD